MTTSEDRAAQEQLLADTQEATEARMHSVADALPDPAGMHQRADRLSERAAVHARRAAQHRGEASAS